ncbi:hypothetical protein A2533_00465 [Candidatus Falkowbacteria bacterium RIFOXYD2_FULL_35_9]|uniref:Serine hydrolase family protein n=2 Tax=Candidatus Falkowiibacteriota TaxID=1752728 RepID=A0A1F5T013_9BACT|nr:MAG: hypothetical protein A2242_00945 [Candidatus Falkowbacteria bacterium RIFOXYA2_FULL_47_9]OGF30840.1 MAG: hypothetical protein A2300_03145 [Candidatus Falkowbacteria bacterium RIFOXYB2_FULL_35_7]OGF32305.1 MAG: hypothetical protein A2478_03200 [Candidatus Falkowbacteria bacterium RIFOXYC2_FULL_36_12]OGF46644.1 MAG: hypothetical protein A2533_00465 [Candidatus Falkowbacteria bacterium RIFOXYD2_FULL_35_9]
MKKVILVHGWDGSPENAWFPWLRENLIKNEFEVIVPAMPNPSQPNIAMWIKQIGDSVKEIDEQTYFVGHGIGCQAVARFLEKVSDGKKVGGVVFVAGFFQKLNNEDDDEIDKEIANDWLKAPINFAKVASHIHKSLAIFSDDDPVVPLVNIDDFRDKLGCKIIIEKNKGHFDDYAKVLELQSVLDFLLKK